MALKIFNIASGSLTSGKLQAGDLLISINENDIADFLDLQFHSADDELCIKYSRKSGIVEEIYLIQDWDTPLGVEPEIHRCRTCANNCIFCFVDQMRPDFRKTLYVKDDDYRLSFVYGNFITLTNLANRDIDRIIEQRLQPLYISVHTTDVKLHKKMLRYKHDFDIKKTLSKLAENKIEMHTQIVIVPGWNDGEALRSSLQDLTSSKLNALSVGIVPVGLTRYRDQLWKLKPVDDKTAKEVVNISSRFPRTYCSDELYLQAKVPIPPAEFYDDFPQLENGIGMIALLLRNWQENKSEFIADLQKMDQDFVLITGELAYETICILADEINQCIEHNVRVQKIKNDFFGISVTVTGLLTAADIIKQTKLSSDEIAIVSSAIFNAEGLTLDNVAEDKLRKELNLSMIIVDEEFDSWELS